MVRIRNFDSKSEKNRERVRRHRQKQKLKLNYECQVQKIINANRNYTENSKLESEHIFDEPNIGRDETFTIKLKK